MLRQISYRTAFFAFLVAFLWLLLGAVMLLSPIPSTLDISWEFFGAWIVLFFLIAAAGGALLTVAALNDFVSRPRGGAPGGAEQPSLWTSTASQPAARQSARRQG
jgi:hypothetical protein